MPYVGLVLPHVLKEKKRKEKKRKAPRSRKISEKESVFW
jgi:hypothetical protein